MALITVKKENGDNSSFSNGKGGDNTSAAGRCIIIFTVLALNKAHVNKTNKSLQQENSCMHHLRGVLEPD